MLLTKFLICYNESGERGMPLEAEEGIEVWHEGKFIAKITKMKELQEILNIYNPIVLFMPRFHTGMEVTRKNLKTPEIQEFLQRNLRISRYRVRR